MKRAGERRIRRLQASAGSGSVNFFEGLQFCGKVLFCLKCECYRLVSSSRVVPGAATLIGTYVLSFAAVLFCFDCMLGAVGVKN